MKKNYILASLLVTLTTQATELEWVQTQVDAIKPPRVGLSLSNINSLKNPMVLFVKKETKKDKSKTKTNTDKKDVVISPSKTNNSNSNTGSIIVNKNRVQEITKTLVLEAIINKSAMISGNWYRLGSIVSGYKLAEVNLTSVVLTKNNKRRVLSTLSKKSNLKFNNK